MSVIYVDADACPVKEEVYRVAGRYGMAVQVVSNRFIRVPQDPLVTLSVVGDGFDAADDHIATRAGPGDIVVTADIPLADRALKGGAQVLGPTGRPFTPAGIGAALAGRSLAEHLRAMGEPTRGPAPFTPADRSRFLQALDTMVRRSRAP